MRHGDICNCQEDAGGWLVGGDCKMRGGMMFGTVAVAGKEIRIGDLYRERFGFYRWRRRLSVSRASVDCFYWCFIKRLNSYHICIKREGRRCRNAWFLSMDEGWGQITNY